MNSNNLSAALPVASLDLHALASRRLPRYLTRVTRNQIFVQDVLLLLSLAATFALIVFSFIRRIWPTRSSGEWEKATPSARRQWAVTRGLVMGTLYFVAGGFWILFSDQFVAEMFENKQLELVAQNFKGVGFVAITAILLGRLATRGLREVVTTETKLRLSEEQFRSVFQHSATGMLLISLDGKFQAVNQAFCRMLGYSENELVGSQFATITHPEDLPACHQQIQSLIAGRQETLQLEKRFRAKDGRLIWVAETGSLMHDEQRQPQFLIVQVEDITERRTAQEALRELSARFLQAQDEERRRIARELHDNTAQELAALNMNLTRLRRSETGPREKFETILTESIALAEQCSQNIRTLSYLLHPPELETLGLPGAIREYASGLAQRSGIHTQVTIATNLGRLPREMEIALFRIVQEGLGNILRHAHAKTAHIRLHRPDHHITLEIQDDGSGIPADTLTNINNRRGTGVGLAGMRERLHQLDGQFEIRSSPAGTTIRATVPLPAKTT